MKFHLLVNSGSSLHEITSVEIPKDVWSYITSNYNPNVHGGEAGVFLAGKIADQLYQALSDRDAEAEKPVHEMAIYSLSELLRAVTLHHAASVDVKDD